jgi:hypothetical protein
MAEPLEPRLALAGDITTGLIHHWTFDETSGDTAHDSAGASDGTLVNWLASQPKWEPGRVGGALRFSSTGSYVIAPSTPMSGSFAVSFWLNDTEPAGPNARIITPEGGNIIFINHESNRGVSFLSNGAVDFSVAAFCPDPPLFNVWEQYVINYNASTKQGVIYRGGAPVAIAGFNEFPQIGSWVIGHSEDLSNHNETLHGALDDLRIYDRVLTDDDIAQLASMGTPEATHQGPVNYWPFDETTGFTAHDTAGGADGILLNWNQTEPRWEPGKEGGALRFSTADDALVTSSVATGAQWTIAFWLKLKARTGVNPRIREPWAYINQESDLGVGFTSRNINTFDPTPVSLDTWEHYTITFDPVNDVGTIYRNGIAVKSGFFGDNSPASAWIFGHQSGDLGNHNDSLDGLLDDFRHYDRLLTPSEIQRLASLTPVVVANDSYKTSANSLLDVPTAQGVLKNDSDLDDSSPNAVVDVGPAHGDLTLNLDGSFTYQPVANYNGDDSFTYHLQDSRGNDVVGTVSLTITPVNQAPTFTRGPDVIVSSEHPFGPSQTVVTFDGLKGLTGQGEPFIHYTEKGFVVTPPPGIWRVLATSSPTPSAVGNPAPAIWEETFNSSLEVTSATGGTFTFAGLDMMGPSAAISFTGLLNSQTVFTSTTTIPADAPGLFQAITSPSGATIDKLLIAIQRNNTENTEIDNIRLTSPNWAMNISAGDPNEGGQALNFEVISDRMDLFMVGPTISPFGQLTFTPQHNSEGTATVTVTLHDDGGTANGGIDTSQPQTFQIQITKPHRWSNDLNQLDVNGDGVTAPNDAVAIVNYLNAGLPTAISPTADIGGPLGFLDTDHDDNISPNDVLQVINFINAGGQSGPAGSVIPLGKDFTTPGDWQTAYGADGYALAIGVANLPSYAQLSFSGKYDYVSDTNAGEQRALSYPDSGYRFAADWTGQNSLSIPLNVFVMDLNLTDNQSHRVAIYILD